MGVLDGTSGTSGTSADVPGVGLKRASVSLRKVVGKGNYVTEKEVK